MLCNAKKRCPHQSAKYLYHEQETTRYVKARLQHVGHLLNSKERVL